MCSATYGPDPQIELAISAECKRENGHDGRHLYFDADQQLTWEDERLTSVGMTLQLP